MSPREPESGRDPVPVCGLVAADLGSQFVDPLALGGEGPVEGAECVLEARLVPVSLLLGPVWRTLNPLGTLHLLICKAARINPRHGIFTLPTWVCVWPAAAGLFAFTWLELVAPDRATLPVLQAWFALYVAILTIGAMLFGDRWFAAADPFDAYATLMSRLSPFGRRTYGAIVARRPLENLDGLAPQPGMVALVSALRGSTAMTGSSTPARGSGGRRTPTTR